MCEKLKCLFGHAENATNTSLLLFQHTLTHTHTQPQGHWESNSCQMAVVANLTSLISGGVSQPVSQPSPLGRYDSHSQWDVIRPAAGLARCFLL